MVCVETIAFLCCARGRQISERFAHPRARLDHEVALFLERVRYAGRHFLLLRTELEILRLGQEALVRKNRADLLDKFAAQGVF